MLIIWGTKVNQENRGVVADRCSVCAEIERFDVIDHFEVGHIYFISLGRGARVASTRTCWTCGTQFNCDSDAYDAHLLREDAELMEVDDIIEHTNTPLAKARESRRKLREIASEPEQRSSGESPTHMKSPNTPLRDRAPGALDRELREAISRLEAYEDGGPDVESLFTELKAWRKLDLPEREALLAKVDRFIDQQQKIQRAVSFIQMIAVSYPQLSGCLPALALLAVLASGFWWLPIPWNVWLTIGYIVAGLLAACVLFYFWGQRGKRRWYRNTLIPKAEENGVDLQMLAGVLAAIAVTSQNVNEKVRDLSNDASLLQEVLIESGK